MDNLKIGSAIKELRKNKGLTQEELAAKLGLQKSAIAKYENGRVSNIKRTTLQKMIEIFECSPAVLLGYEEPTNLGLPKVSDPDIYKEVAELSNIYMHLSKEDQEYLLHTARRLAM